MHFRGMGRLTEIGGFSPGFGIGRSWLYVIVQRFFGMHFVDSHQQTGDVRQRRSVGKAVSLRLETPVERMRNKIG